MKNSTDYPITNFLKWFLTNNPLFSFFFSPAIPVLGALKQTNYKTFSNGTPCLPTGP